MGGRGASGRSVAQATTTTATTASVEDRIRQVFDQIAPRNPWGQREHASITDIRKALAGEFTDAQLDAAMRRLAHDPDVDMMPEANQKILTTERRRHAVRVGGQDSHLIKISK
jgi:pyruvate/2-oxoglutarate dehydrogenase complex dihydrolipoamide acyltransferase (E2) component